MDVQAAATWKVEAFVGATDRLVALPGAKETARLVHRTEESLCVGPTETTYREQVVAVPLPVDAFEERAFRRLVVAGAQVFVLLGCAEVVARNGDQRPAREPPREQTVL